MSILFHNDQPITQPVEDCYGVDPFARALAISIRKMISPTGAVIALNGPWGSGKSSAVNLVRHYLADAVKAGDLAIIDFTCWWFRGEDALALAFFRELYAGLSPSLGDKIKKALPKLGARLLRTGSVVGGVVDAVVPGGAGAAAGGVMDWLGGLIQAEDTVESLHRELSEALAGQKKRFLIVIDDIDRLAPDEALLIFRLVKSVGRLPNVIYLLVYDRHLAEKIVSERYPSEGPHYLEKIVQAAFELPEPSAIDVEQHLLGGLKTICGSPDEDHIVRFMNLFHEGIAPAMRTPRDVARFINSLNVTWPAVVGEVDTADFLTLEVLRLIHPTIYRAIRQNKELMCRGEPSVNHDRDARADRYRQLLLGSVQPPDDDRLRRVLMRLFPVLESVWVNNSYGDDFALKWSQERRVCSMDHFDSYFRFTVSDEVVPRAELDELIRRAGDHDYVETTMRRAITVMRRAGGTKAAVLLTALETHANRIGKEVVLPLLTALFSVADEINVEADEAQGFSVGNNEWRLHWLLRRLILEGMTLEERSAVLLQSCQTAAVGWLAHLTFSAWEDYHPRDGKAPEPAKNCLTTEVDAERLRCMLLVRIEAAAKDNILASHRNLRWLLHVWSDLAGDDDTAVRTWTAALCASDVGVQHLAKAFTSFVWSQGMGFTGLGDLVAKRTTRAHVEHLGKFVDVEAFRKRVEEVAAKGLATEVVEFWEAWQRADRGGRRGRIANT